MTLAKWTRFNVSFLADVAQASDAKSEAKASDELSEDEIKAIVGGVFRATLLKADLGD